MKPYHLLVFAALPWVACGPALAQDAALERCRSIEGPTARLACYDAALPPRAATAPGTPGASNPTSIAPTPPAVATKPLLATPPGATMRAETAPSAAVALPRNSQNEFGFESRRRPADTPADHVVTSYQGMFGGWGPAEKIPLANGQVWQIADGSQTGYEIKNPVVRIVRGAFGSFFMEIEGVSQSPRVRRVQ